MATLRPRSRWRSVAMRRPGCTASLLALRRRAEPGGGRVEVVDGQGQAEERGRTVIGRGLEGADQLEITSPARKKVWLMGAP